MGVQTLIEFREDIQLKLGNRGDVALTDSLLNRCINECYLEMTSPNVKQFKTLKEGNIQLTLVADQDCYLVFASDARRILALDHAYFVDSTVWASPTIGVRVVPLLPRDDRLLDRRTRHNSQPRYYSFERGAETGGPPGTNGDYIRVDPVPGTAEVGKLIVVEGWAEPTRLSIDSDITVMPQQFDASLSAGSIAKLMEKLPGMFEEALVQTRIYQTKFNNTINFGDLEADDWGHRSDIAGQDRTTSNYEH